MKISKILFSTVILFFFILLSCEEEETVELYEQESISLDDSTLMYDKLTAYPALGSIQSANPTGVEFETPYRFRLLKISSSTQSSFVPAAFSIDPESGVLSYNNANNTIGIGTFSVDVGIANTNGMAVKENAFELTILDVPATINIDITEVEAGIFEEGIMATVSYTDNSGSGAISSATYALIDPPAGFQINSSTGAISKVSGAISGPNILSVRVTTNAGVVIAENILTVNVGEAPTIEMTQQDGTTLLTKTILSPNTPYTTSAPKVVGMVPAVWDVILPKSLFNDNPDISAGEVAIDFSSAFSVENPSGKVSVYADSGLPLGIHVLSLKATNSTGNEYTFEDVLTIEVEERWDTNPIYENDLTDLGTQIKLHELNGSTSIMGTTGSHGKTQSPVVKWQTLNNNTARKDGAMEVKVPISNTLKKVRISFYEAFGYNNFFVQRHTRELSTYQATDASDPSLTPSSWDLEMDGEDTAWSGTNGWPTLGPDINTMNKVTSKGINVSQGTQNFYFFLRLYRMDGKDPIQGQWVIRNVSVEGSSAFPAEEQ